MKKKNQLEENIKTLKAMLTISEYIYEDEKKFGVICSTFGFPCPVVDELMDNNRGRVLILQNNLREVIDSLGKMQS